MIGVCGGSEVKIDRSRALLSLGAVENQRNSLHVMRVGCRRRVSPKTGGWGVVDDESQSLQSDAKSALPPRQAPWHCRLNPGRTLLVPKKTPRKARAAANIH